MRRSITRYRAIEGIQLSIQKIAEICRSATGSTKSNGRDGLHNLRLDIIKMFPAHLSGLKGLLHFSQMLRIIFLDHHVFLAIGCDTNDTV